MGRRIVLIEQDMTARSALRARYAAAGYQAESCERLTAGCRDAELIVLSAARSGHLSGLCRQARETFGSGARLLAVSPGGRARSAYLAGADHVVAGDAPDSLLLARTRAAMAMPRPQQEMAGYGFAEAGGAGFRHRLVAAVVTDRPALAAQCRAAVTGAGYASRVVSPDDLLAQNAGSRWPDLLLVEIDGNAPQQGAALIAELRQRIAESSARPGIVALLHAPAPTVEVLLLDLGAGDVLYLDELRDGNAAAASLRLRAEQRRAALAGRLRAQALYAQELAGRDPLTGLGNRRFFAPRLAHALSSGGKGALLLLDLDRFKTVNDRYGHAAGDAVLEQTGRLLRDLPGGAHQAARIGGEEFAVLLTRCDEAEAVAMAERIRVALGRHMVTAPGLDGTVSLSVSASIGVAAFGADDARDPAAVMAAADRALIRAKAAGRNLVLLARDESPPAPARRRFG